eukprot:1124242-Rhodomonas_salina.1
MAYLPIQQSTPHLIPMTWHHRISLAGSSSPGRQRHGVINHHRLSASESVLVTPVVARFTFIASLSVVTALMIFLVSVRAAATHSLSETPKHSARDSEPLAAARDSP